MDFIRGKYALSDLAHVRHIICEMSQNEHEKIKEAESFSKLWYDFWNVSITKNSHKHEERMARQKYDLLKKGIAYGSNEKNVYIFRQNNELLISQNGKVEKATWEY